MEQRLKPYRRLAFLTLTISLVVGAPWFGFWTVGVLAGTSVVFGLVDHRLQQFARPEFGIALAWLLTQLSIAAGIALTGGPRSVAVSWLAIPLVTLPARFNGHAVRAGVVVTVALMLAVTLGVDPSYVVGYPPSVLGPVAGLVGVALLSSALMKSDLEHRSSSVIDPLTGMLNRNALQTRVAELVQQAAILREPVAVIVGDVDSFKAINDGHGHAAGDAVLKDLAYRIRKALRAYDLAYRLGGEEFLVMLPGADLAKAAEVAEGIRAAIADAPMAGLLVTMSFGVSASPEGAFDYDNVFAQADLALYRAKQDGRNRVCLHEPGAAPPAALAA
jgi:diguanylate cyclase (GGDEF)-like protein